MDILGAIILGIHAMAALMGFTFSSTKGKSLSTGLGIVAILVSALFVMIMLDGGPGGTSGTYGAWYLIFSVVTIGIIPFITLWSAFTSGRFFKAISF